MDWLHTFLNAPLFGPDSDLAWSAVRIVTGLASGITAWNLGHARGWGWLFWATLFLGIWIALKVVDDALHPGGGAKLTMYFLLSNAAWTVILLGLNRVVVRRGKLRKQNEQLSGEVERLRAGEAA